MNGHGYGIDNGQGYGIDNGQGYRTDFEKSFHQIYNLDAIKRKNLRIISLTLIKAKNIPNYRRSKHIFMDDPMIGHIKGDFDRYGSNAFSMENLSNKYASMLSYDSLANGVMIEGGWNENRYAFELVLETIEPDMFSGGEMTIRTYVNGYTHMYDVTYKGTMSPDTVFITNDILRTSITSKGENILGAYNILHNPDTNTNQFNIDYEMMALKNKDSMLYSLRPEDLNISLASRDLYNGFDDNDKPSIILDNVVGKRPIESDVNNNSPFSGVSETLRNYSMAMETSEIGDTPYEIGMRASTANAGMVISNDTFFSWLSDNQSEEVSSFTYSELCDIFSSMASSRPINGLSVENDYVDDKILRVDQIEHVPTNNFYDANISNGGSVLQTTAHMALDSLQPLIKRLRISECSFLITNMTIDGSVHIKHNMALILSVGGLDHMSVIRFLDSNLQLKIFPLLTKKRFNMSLNITINKLGAKVDITIDGLGSDSIAYSMYAYSGMSPVIGSYSEQEKTLDQLNLVTKILK